MSSPKDPKFMNDIELREELDKVTRAYIPKTEIDVLDELKAEKARLSARKDKSRMNEETKKNINGGVE